MCDICLSSPCLPGCPNAPEPDPVYTCNYCGDGIYEGDEYAEIDGCHYHRICLEDEMPFENLLGLFDVRVQIAQEEDR